MYFRDLEKNSLKRIKMESWDQEFVIVITAIELTIYFIIITITTAIVKLAKKFAIWILWEIDYSNLEKLFHQD